MKAAYRVHKMIQDIFASPDRASAFANDHEPEFARYELSVEEKAALIDGSRAALARLGVHPSLQMKFGRIRRPAKTGGHSLEAAYLDRLLERV